MIRLVLAMVIGGGILVFMGVQEMRLASGTTAEPKQLTCADLIASGPGDNAHVEMGEFLLCEMSYVYEGSNENSMTTVWIPAVPLNGAFHQRLMKILEESGPLGNIPTPRDIHVIVKSSKVDDEDAVTQLGGQDTIRGMIVNRISSLDSEEKKLLKQSYPSIDFDNVWIVEHGRQPAGAAKMLGFFGGGIALIVIGGFVGFSTMSSEE